MAREPSRDDLDALKDGASLLLQSGNRIAALSLLWSAVAIDPTDQSAHRRLAATLATGGDLDGAAEEFGRYIDFVVPLGDVGRAASELSYGVNMIGGHPALERAADRIASAVRALVPPPGPALRPSAPLAAIAAAAAPSVMTRPVAVPPAQPVAAQPVAAQQVPSAAAQPAPVHRVQGTPLPAPRLLPKVPFRVCVHETGDRQWVRLEGGHRGLVPVSVRVSDASDRVLDESPCMPLPIAGAHGSRGLLAQPVVYAVVGIQDPNRLAGHDQGRFSEYRFEARVNGEWLAVELFDTPCRLAMPSNVQRRSALSI